MERTDLLDMMTTLKLYGMKNAYDEILATALKRQHEPQRFAGDLLKAEISEKQARWNRRRRSPDGRHSLRRAQRRIAGGGSRLRPGDL